MRQQQAIVAASGPRTPINDPTSNRIGHPRNGGDSGIFTAAGRLRPLSSFDCKGADAGQNQSCSSAQCGRSSPLRPRTTAPGAVPAGGGPQPLWTIPHQNTQSHGGGRQLRVWPATSHRWRPWPCRPTGVDRPPSEERTRPPRGLPRITRCRSRPLYPKPRSAAMAKPVSRPDAGRPIGRVPTPDRSGRHEGAQQGLHSRPRSPLAGWI
jgi:hypothetical protein